MTEQTQPNLGTVTEEERNKFYADSECTPTSCERALGLPRVVWLHKANKAKPFRKVIELGCHDGFSTRWLLNSPHLDALVGIELSESAHKHAERLAKEKIFPELATYYCEDIFAFEGGHLDVEPGEHDVVVCFELIEHLPEEDSARLLRLCHELMSEDGRCFLTTPHIDGPFGKSNPDPAHIHFYDERSLAKAIEQETGCFATIINVQGILHALWRKDGTTDGQKKEAQDAEGSGDSSQGSEDPEGRDGQREAADGSAEAILRQDRGGSEADSGSQEEALTIEQLRALQPPTLAELEAMEETSIPPLPDGMEESPLTIEQRIERLEAVAHAPVLTYSKGTMDSKVAALKHEIIKLQARIEELEGRESMRAATEQGK